MTNVNVQLKDGSELNGVDLEEVVRLYAEKDFINSIEDLIEADNDDDIVVFKNPKDCFWWINDSRSSLESFVADLLTKNPKEINADSILDYALDEENIVVLENGTTIFIYC